MIANARVLQADFVPREVQHRDAKVRVLAGALEPITVGDSGETSMLFGPSGVGKTCISRYTVSQLEEETLDIDTQYVNAWEDHSEFKLLYRILEGIGQTVDIHRQSTPTDELLERVREVNDGQYVVIIDEVDQLDDTSVLYELYRVPELTMVLIANREEELLNRIGERLRSRLAGSTRVKFDPYTNDELVSILEDRVRWGLEPGVIHDEQVDHIAEAAAGDARKALGFLRQAAKTAIQANADEITSEHIERAIPEAKTEIRQQSLSKLTRHQRVLYEIIEENDGIAPGNLHEAYAERVADPLTKRMMRNHLSKMQHYNLVTATGATRARKYEITQ